MPSETRKPENSEQGGANLEPRSSADLGGELPVTPPSLDYNPRDVSTWTPEQKREAFERQMRARPSGGPLVIKTREDIEAAIEEMRDE